MCHVCAVIVHDAGLRQEPEDRLDGEVVAALKHPGMISKRGCEKLKFMTQAGDLNGVNYRFFVMSDKRID